jgi:hypothetical protein
MEPPDLLFPANMFCGLPNQWQASGITTPAKAGVHLEPVDSRFHGNNRFGANAEI